MWLALPGPYILRLTFKTLTTRSKRFTNETGNYKPVKGDNEKAKLICNYRRLVLKRKKKLLFSWEYNISMNFGKKKFVPRIPKINAVSFGVNNLARFIIKYWI